MGWNLLLHWNFGFQVSKLRGSALLFVTVNSSFCFLSFSGFYVTTRQQPPGKCFPRAIRRSALPGAVFFFYLPLICCSIAS